MATIAPGTYTIRDLLDASGIDYMGAAAVDYNSDGWDRRRIRVGGLSWNDFDEVVVVPEGAGSVSISIDGEDAASITVS